MKKTIIWTLLGLFLLTQSAAAMSISDVLQQLSVYRTQATASAIGAFDSTTTTTPTKSVVPAPLPKEGPDVLIKGLYYTKNSTMIVPTTVKIGTANSDTVRALQAFLVAKGYLKADPTGTYGAATKEAVRKFQLDKKIVSDGSIVGPATRAAIQKDVQAVVNSAQ